MEPKTRKSKMSLEEMNKIDELLAQGKSTTEIAEQLKRKKPTITTYLKNREVRRKKAEGGLTEQQKEAILELHGRKVSVRKIIKTLNLACSVSTIWYVINPNRRNRQTKKTGRNPERNLEEEDQENTRDTVDAMEEDQEEADHEEDVMEDDVEVGDIRRGEEGDFDDFGASTSHEPVEAEGSPADGMDEHEEDNNMEVGVVRRVFHEDVDDIEALRRSEPEEEVMVEPEDAEGHDEYEEDGDAKDLRDVRIIGRLPPWFVRDEFFDGFESSTRSQPGEEVSVEPEVMNGASDAEGSNEYEPSEDEEVIRSEQRIGDVCQEAARTIQDDPDFEDSRIQEPEVVEMEVDVAEREEASEVVEDEPELVRMGRRTDVGNWSRVQVQAWADQFLSPEQSVCFQRMQLTGAGLLYLHFDPQPSAGLQPPEGLEDVLQIIKPHLHPIADIERSRIDEERESGVLLLENQDDDPGRRTFKSSQCFMNSICALLFSCREIREALRRESEDPLLQMISGIFSRRINSARGWRATLDHEYRTGLQDIRFVFQELMMNLRNHENRVSSLQFTQCKVKKCVDCQDIDFRFTNGEVWSTMDVNFLTVYNGSFNDSVRAAYSPKMVSGECSHCGGVVQQTTIVEAQQARYHFARISGAISDINSESEVAMFGDQWRIRGFAERVVLGGEVGHFVSWVRNLDHWYLVNDERSRDMGREAVEFERRNVMILVFEKIL